MSDFTIDPEDGRIGELHDSELARVVNDGDGLTLAFTGTWEGVVGFRKGAWLFHTGAVFPSVVATAWHFAEGSEEAARVIPLDLPNDVARELKRRPTEMFVVINQYGGELIILGELVR